MKVSTVIEYVTEEKVQNRKPIKPTRSKRTKPKHNVNEIINSTQGVPVVYQNTRFGAAQVLLEDMAYSFTYTKNQISHYRCSRYRSQQCPAEVVVNNKLVYYLCAAHNHDLATGQQLDGICRSYLARDAT
nr:uncharacterized protein LOC115253649 [Aedes albopictus]